MSEADYGTAGVITSIERRGKQRQRYDVFVDGQYAITVHEDILIRHRFLKGSTVTKEGLEQAVLEDAHEDAYRRTLRWLGAKPRTEGEILQYLHRIGCDEPSVQQEIISRLKGHGYIDDEQFSKMWLDERLRRQERGTMLIRQELINKGVDRRIVEETMAAADPDDEKAAAAALARKRWPRLAASGDLAAARRKLYAYLARRGYPESVVRTVLREVRDDADLNGTGEDADDWNG